MALALVSDVVFPLPTGHAPRGAGPLCAGDPAPLAAADTGAAPAPTPRDKQATEAPAPCNLYPIPLSSVTFLAKGGSVGKKSSVRQTFKGSV